MTSCASDNDGGVLVGVAPMRLAVAPTRDLPGSVADERHEEVARLALEWQQTAGKATFWEAGATAQGAGEGRVYSLAGQMASAGEQLGLAHAGAVEVALWNEVRRTTVPDPTHEMCMRAMAEAQSLFVVGTGHALANVAVRALALHPALRAQLGKRFARGDVRVAFDPFSQKHSDWVSLNAESCRHLRAVARSSNVQEVVELVQPVVDFGTGQSWRELLERRGEDFHRWRPQTHGIEGVPRTSPWRREGRSRVLSIGHPAYEEAHGLADETARLATEAMLGLALSMKAFLERWPVASGHLGGPRFKLA